MNNVGLKHKLYNKTNIKKLENLASNILSSSYIDNDSFDTIIFPIIRRSYYSYINNELVTNKGLNIYSKHE